MVSNPSPASILIIDDQSENLVLLEALLSPIGYHLVTACTGESGFNYALEQEFSLILLDVNMPGMNGLETAAKFHQESKLKLIPIIFITATEASELQIFQGYESGAIDYVIKPINSQLLLNKVRIFIQLFQQQQRLKQQNLILENLNQKLASKVQECQVFEKKLRDSNSHLSILLDQQTQALNQSEELYCLILSNISDAVLVTDEEGNFTFVSPSVDNILGYSQTEIFQLNNITKLLGTNIEKSADLAWYQKMANVEILVLDRFGHPHNLLINVKKVAIGQRSPAYLVSLHDITQHNQIKEALTKSESQYRHLLDHIQCGVIVHTPDTRIVYANPAASDFLGLVQTQLEGKSAEDPHWRFYFGDGSPMSPTDFPVNKVLREQVSLFNYEVGVFRASHQDVFWVWVNAYPECGSNGEISQIIVTFVDITERKKNEFSLQNLNVELEHLVEQRTRELEATNSHLLREMIEREQVDHALQQEEAKYRALMRDASDAIFALDTERNFLEFNQKAELLTGYTRTEMKYISYEQLIPVNHQQRMKTFLQEIRRDRLGSWTNGTLLNKERAVIPVDMTGSLIQYEDKTIIQLIVRDITDRQRTEAELQKNEAQFRAIFETAAIGIALVNPLGYAYQVNASLSQILGYSASELSQLKFNNITHPDDRQRNWQLFQELIKGQRDTYQLEKRYLRADGSSIWTYLTASLVRNRQGQPLFTVAMIEDISNRKQAEQSLQQNQLFLRNIIDTNPNWIFVKDDQGRYTLMNKAIAHAYGKSIEEMLGKTDQELLLKQEEANQYRNDDQQVINFREPLWIPEEYCTLPNGQRRILQTHKIPILSADGQVYEVLGVATDITERKRAEEEIQKALQAEKELNEMKTQFVDIISHEFRTPLTSILGFTELLKRYHNRIEPNKQLHYIQNIHNAGNRLNDLIDDVLSLSRLDAGRLKINPINLPIRQFCQGLLEEFNLGLGQYHILIFNCSDSMSEIFYLDERLLAHILTNLLSNSIKYSSPGSPITLTVSLEAETLIFQVSDRGIGIPPEDQTHLFESFHRASNVGDIQGTGLGLNIVKRYVELHGGSITFESIVNEGTTFKITLPYLSI